MADTPVEIFAIGTELVIGRIQDTNSHWMAQRVGELGGSVRRITALVDDLDDIVGALRESLSRGTRLLLVSGGLGPTPDDLTIEAVARVLTSEVVVDEATLEDYMRRRNLSGRDQLTPGLMKMATVPAGAEVCPNPAGWAPCTICRAGEATLIVLPGPPREMEAVFTLHVAGRVAALTAHKSAALRVVVNMYESEESPILQEVMARHPGTYLKAYVAMREAFDKGLPVDIVATGEDEEGAQRLLQTAVTFFGGLVNARGKTMEYYDEA
jgi:molybdenum cofactor synthesis domain-containing protein